MYLTNQKSERQIHCSPRSKYWPTKYKSLKEIHSNKYIFVRFEKCDSISNVCMFQLHFINRLYMQMKENNTGENSQNIDLILLDSKIFQFFNIASPVKAVVITQQACMVFYLGQWNSGAWRFSFDKQ